MPLAAQSALNQKEFKKYWRIESEAPDYRVAFRGDTCELTAPKGLTLWRKQPFTANTIVEYDVLVTDDRLSDMNCFWLASDPQHKDIWQRADWRSGIFTRCYTLQMYYLGYGGNHNTTTRFRRYTGDERDIAFLDQILKDGRLRACLGSHIGNHRKIKHGQLLPGILISPGCQIKQQLFLQRVHAVRQIPDLGKIDGQGIRLLLPFFPGEFLICVLRLRRGDPIRFIAPDGDSFLVQVLIDHLHLLRGESGMGKMLIDLLFVYTAAFLCGTFPDLAE